MRPAGDLRETCERPAKDPRKTREKSLPRPSLKGGGKRVVTILRRYIAKRYRSPICEEGKNC